MKFIIQTNVIVQLRKQDMFNDEKSTNPPGLFKVNNTDKINSFQINVLFLYPLKTSENFWDFYFFRGYRKRTLFRNKLIITLKIRKGQLQR